MTLTKTVTKPKEAVKPEVENQLALRVNRG